MALSYRCPLFTALLACLLSSLLCACGEAQQRLPRLAPDDLVLAFGDSLTYGSGAQPHESYPEVLAGLIARRVVRDGVPGETSAAGLERLPQALDQHQPRLLLLCLGGNDLLRRLDPAQTESNLRAMVRLAKDRGIAVVLIGVPKAQLFGGVAQFYHDVAADYDLPLEAEVLTDVLYDNALKSDHIHPNAAGYRRLAQALDGLLRRSGALP